MILNVNLYAFMQIRILKLRGLIKFESK